MDKLENSAIAKSDHNISNKRSTGSIQQNDIVTSVTKKKLSVLCIFCKWVLIESFVMILVQNF